MIPPPTTATVGAFILTKRVSRFLLLNISSTAVQSVEIRELVIVCLVTSHWFYWIINGQNFYFI